MEEGGRASGRGRSGARAAGAEQRDRARRERRRRRGRAPRRHGTARTPQRNKYCWRRRGGQSEQASARRVMFTQGSTTSGRNGKGTCYETDRRTCWANARWKSGRPLWSVRREDDTTGKTAGCENGEGRTRSGRKGSGGYGPGTREREGSTSNHTTVTYTHTTPHIPITAQPQQYHAGSSRTLHTPLALRTGRGEARPTGCRSRTGAPCNKGVGDVGTGPNSRTEQNTRAPRSPPPAGSCRAAPRSTRLFSSRDSSRMS